MFVPDARVTDKRFGAMAQQESCSLAARDFGPLIAVLQRASGNTMGEKFERGTFRGFRLKAVDLMDRSGGVQENSWEFLEMSQTSGPIGSPFLWALRCVQGCIPQWEPYRLRLLGWHSGEQCCAEPFSESSVGTQPHQVPQGGHPHREKQHAAIHVRWELRRGFRIPVQFMLVHSLAEEAHGTSSPLQHLSQKIAGPSNSRAIPRAQVEPVKAATGRTTRL